MALYLGMADTSRLRFGTNSSSSPSKVPLARISELFDDDYTVPVGDRNHNSVPPVTNCSRPELSDNNRPDTSNPNQTLNQTYQTTDGVALVPRSGGDKGHNPVYPNLCAYFGAALFFLLGMNVSGLSLLSYPLVGNLLWYKYQNIHFPDGVICLQFMWCAHFVRRFGEVLFVHIYRRKMPFFESIGASVYYWLFGLWVGWSVNLHLGYRVPSLPLFVPGVIVFVVGEVGNGYSHWRLQAMRLQPSGQAALSARKRVIPTGFLFDYISYPHYFFELLSWVGFYLSSHTLAAGFFLLASAATMIFRAVKGHRKSKQEFNGADGTPLYPPKRKAIIPFIL